MCSMNASVGGADLYTTSCKKTDINSNKTDLTAMQARVATEHAGNNHFRKSLFVPKWTKKGKGGHVYSYARFTFNGPVRGLSAVSPNAFHIRRTSVQI